MCVQSLRNHTIQRWLYMYIESVCVCVHNLQVQECDLWHRARWGGRDLPGEGSFHGCGHGEIPSQISGDVMLQCLSTDALIVFVCVLWGETWAITCVCVCVCRICYSCSMRKSPWWRCSIKPKSTSICSSSFSIRNSSKSEMLRHTFSHVTRAFTYSNIVIILQKHSRWTWFFPRVITLHLSNNQPISHCSKHVCFINQNDSGYIQDTTVHYYTIFIYSIVGK